MSAMAVAARIAFVRGDILNSFCCSGKPRNAITFRAAATECGAAQPSTSPVGAPPLVERWDVSVRGADKAQYVLGVGGPDNLGAILISPARHRSRAGGGAALVPASR